MTSRFLPLLLCSTLCLAQEGPAFKTEVNLITTTLLVRSPDGVLVTDLAKADFEILEDGVPQHLQFFAREKELPLSLALIVDVSGSQDRFLKQHNKDIEKFLTTVLSPSDRAAAICFGNRLRLVSDLTSSTDQIMESLHSFVKGGGGFPEIGPPERRILGTALYDAIYFTAKETLHQSGERRKAIVVFSDGEENSSEHDLLDAIEEAQSEDIVVYCIRYTDTERKRIGKHNRKITNLADLIALSEAADQGGDGKLTARNKYGIRAMKHLSELTGGADFDALESDLSDVFAEIGKELHSLYSIGYVSTNPRHDGSFRKLTIQCKRPNALVRAKSGYYAR